MIVCQDTLNIVGSLGYIRNACRFRVSNHSLSYGCLSLPVLVGACNDSLETRFDQVVKRRGNLHAPS